jgi:hypothetical protein
MHQEPDEHHAPSVNAVADGADAAHLASSVGTIASPPHAPAKSRLSVVVGASYDRDAAAAEAAADAADAAHAADAAAPLPPPPPTTTTPTLRVHCATFNMAGRLPPSVPAALVGASQSPDGAGADLLAFATQVRAFVCVCV